MSPVEVDKPERLFIGVAVPERTRLSLARQLPSSLPGKPSPMGNWHFTLRFLGDTEAVPRDRLITRLREAQLGSPFELAFQSLGAFPDARRAKILWAGVGKGKERLESIAQSVEAAAVEAGFMRENRRFSAHLTLSRINPPRTVRELLANARPIDARMRIEEVILYRSELGGPYSKYTMVEAFPLD